MLQKVFLKKEIIELEVYQCKDCLSVYDENFGDITKNIPPKTMFSKLPVSYECSLCEASKTNFKKIVLVK